MYFHGGPASQFKPKFVTTFQYYLKEGYMVVAPNVRGSRGYGQKFMDMDNYKKRMDSVKDGKAVMDDLIKNNLSEKDNFITYGGSYGGFMAVSSMVEYPDNYKCGINSVGVVNFYNFLKNTKSYRRKIREVEYGPLTDAKFLKSVSPSNKVDRIKGSLLVIHGKNDPRVPVSEAYLLIENMKKAKKYVESIIYEDEGHNIRKMENRIDKYSKVLDFMNRCSRDEL